MTIRYRLARADLLLGRLLAIYWNRSIRILYLLVAALFLFASFHDKGVAARGVAFRIVYSGIETVLVLGLAGTVSVVLIASRTYLAKGMGVVCEHTLQLNEEGLVESTAYNVSVHRWPSVRKVRRALGLVMIYVGDEAVHIVPARKPMLEGDLEAFVAQVRVRLCPPPILNNSANPSTGQNL